MSRLASRFPDAHADAYCERVSWATPDHLPFAAPESVRAGTSMHLSLWPADRARPAQAEAMWSTGARKAPFTESLRLYARSDEDILDLLLRLARELLALGEPHAWCIARAVIGDDCPPWVPPVLHPDLLTPPPPPKTKRRKKP